MDFTSSFLGVMGEMKDWLDGYRFANHEFDGECIALN
jgi:hypothetical protein